MTRVGRVLEAPGSSNQNTLLESTGSSAPRCVRHWYLTAGCFSLGGTEVRPAGTTRASWHALDVVVFFRVLRQRRSAVRHLDLHHCRLHHVAPESLFVRLGCRIKRPDE